MWFDVACKFAEESGVKGIADAAKLRRICNAAAIFKFEATPSTDTRDLSSEDRKTLFDLFHLPFKSTSLEDVGGNVIVSDREDNAVGLMGRWRDYVIAMPGGNADGTPDPKLAMFVWGRFQIDREMGGNFEFSVAVDGLAGRDEEGRIGGLGSHAEFVPDGIKRVVTDSLAVAIEQLRQINLPSKFVFEIAPAKVKRRDGAVKITRSHERPIYTVLEPGEIRRRYPFFGSDADGRKSPQPHARRRHLRLLSSDRYVNKKGQYIVIPACWVGPAEHTLNNRRYRVRLDV